MRVSICLMGYLAFSGSVACGAKLVSRAATLPATIEFTIPPPEQLLGLQVFLKYRNIDHLEEELKRRSTPGSPDYGRYMDQDDINREFGPRTESREAVLSWLQRANVINITDHGSYINFVTTISNANFMLTSNFQVFAVDSVQKLRTLQYSVPETVAEHIDLISPTTFFGRIRAFSQIQSVVRGQLRRGGRPTGKPRRQTCMDGITPPCMEFMYRYGEYSANTSSGSRVGFGSFLNASARAGDLAMYQKKHKLPFVSFTTITINGGEDHQDPGQTEVSEANLDSQFLAAASKGLPMTQFITGGRPPFVPTAQIPDDAANSNEPYLEYYEHLMNMTNANLPQVITNSYGEEEQTVPKDYAIRVCNLIAMMGLRGITILYSSGDYGVGKSCSAADAEHSPRFPAVFPASCPYVTAVGGTVGFEPETAWSDSSGGFSDYFSQPWYQKDTVEAYLTASVTADAKNYAKKFVNFSGRAFPDISAHSSSPRYLFILNGTQHFGSGTSASAPVVAGLISLLNDARLRAGQPAMGFLNPWLYAGGHQGVRDVAAGQSRGCHGIVSNTSKIPNASWKASAGWDPVTGFGVPDFDVLLRYALWGLKDGKRKGLCSPGGKDCKYVNSDLP